MKSNITKPNLNIVSSGSGDQMIEQIHVKLEESRQAKLIPDIIPAPGHIILKADDFQITYVHGKTHFKSRIFEVVNLSERTKTELGKMGFPVEIGQFVQLNSDPNLLEVSNLYFWARDTQICALIGNENTARKLYDAIIKDEEEDSEEFENDSEDKDLVSKQPGGGA